MDPIALLGNLGDREAGNPNGFRALHSIPYRINENDAIIEEEH